MQVSLSDTCIEKSLIFTCPSFCLLCVLNVLVVLGCNSGFPMDEEEINEEILRLHGYTSEGDSDDGGKTELDEFYYYHKPQPIDIDPNRDNIIRAGVTKISKNQMRRLRKKFADDENKNKNDNLKESLEREDCAPNSSQLLTKRQKKRLKGKKKLTISEKENLVNDKTECGGALDLQLENLGYEENDVGVPDSELLSKSEKETLKIKKKIISSESSQNIPEVKKEEESPDDGAPKRNASEDFNLLQEENLVQSEQNKPTKGRSFVDLFLLWLRNSYEFRTFATVLIILVVLKKVPYFYNFLKRL
nr:PREDICTED: uncharacterized protein LOC103313878 [Tribolium castaneum]|eukprot:XP_008196533.1 PREDICTED: uncharacterized protein LOC103313878 [Tribolium castaneum]